MFRPSQRPRRRSRLLPLSIIIFALVLLLGFGGPIFTSLARSLIRVDEVAAADVVIALGGDARCLREKRAAELYKEGRARHVIVSGVPYAWGIHTGEAAKRYVASLGVPEEKIHVLRGSWNTRDEAHEAGELMRREGWRAAIIVTSPFHSRRAHSTFERYAGGITYYSSPLPAEPPEWQPEAWWSRRGDMGITVREFLAWGNTLIGGLR